MQSNIQKQPGFTLVELLIVVPIALLIVASFITVLVNLTGDALANREQLVQARDTQSALDRIQQDIRLSNRFLAESRVVISSPQGVNDDTTKFVNASTTTGTALILQSLSTDKNPVDSTRNLVFLTNSPNPCGSALVTSNSPHYVNIVYFVKNNTLYRRTLMTYNPSPAPCVTPWQQPTCAVGQPNGTTCVSEDVVLATGVSGLTIDYYTDPSSSTPIANASDPSQTTAVRDAALVTAGSLRASITLAKTASGRDITFSGAARVAKLNSSSLDPPTSPTISSTISGPAQVTFSWGVVPNATSYVISYNINGGSWIDVPNGVSTTSYAINASRKDVVNIRVAANNSAGTSASTTASATIPPWADCALQNNWINYGGIHATAGYTKTTANVILVKGVIRAGTGAANEVLCTLPPGYRPDHRLVFEISSGSANPGRIDVDVNGDIIYVNGNTGWLNLSDITFLPSGAYSWTHLTSSNSWQDYSVATGDTRYSPLEATKDSLNRAHIQGLAWDGTNTMGTLAFTLPSGYSMAKPNIFTGASSQGHGDMQVSSGTPIVARGIPASWISLQELTYPSSISGWTAVSAASFQNGWTNYDTVGWDSAAYLESADGILSLKGLIKGGSVTSGTVIFTLPVGNRPTEDIICDVTTAPDVYARIDINPNGQVSVSEAGNSGWLSLAGCDFMAEQ